MARIKFHRDSAGIESILSSFDFGQVAAAHQIASVARAHRGADVAVDTYVTDRLVAAVTIRDVRGVAWEVRDGVLSGAAAAIGLEVTRR
jgi:hypothetical protein